MKLCVNTRSRSYKYIVTQHVLVQNVKWGKKKVKAVRKDQELLKIGTIPSQKHQIVVVPQFNIQLVEMRLKKGKVKVSDGVAEQLYALMLCRDTKNELFKRKLDLKQEKLRQKDERNTNKMQLLHLNTLLAKDHLSPQDEAMKNFLMSKFYRK
ncbi:hypothetical protein Hanom_Chr05g00430841 [Helianthus anomalus]